MFTEEPVVIDGNTYYPLAYLEEIHKGYSEDELFVSSESEPEKCIFPVVALHFTDLRKPGKYVFLIFDHEHKHHLLSEYPPLDDWVRHAEMLLENYIEDNLCYNRRAK